MPEYGWTINFHGVGDPPAKDMEPGEHAVWLSMDAYRGVLDAVAGNPAVDLTFDDGNASDLERALPELVRRDLKAAFFICAGRLGERHYLDDAGVRELHAAGMRIGSHGWSHVPWRGLETDTARREWVESKDRLEQTIGASVHEAACPFGSYDRRVLSGLRAAGYGCTHTSDRGPFVRGAWLRPRITAHAGDTGNSVPGWLRRPTGLAAIKRSAKLAMKRIR